MSPFERLAAAAKLLEHSGNCDLAVACDLVLSIHTSNSSRREPSIEKSAKLNHGDVVIVTSNQRSYDLVQGVVGHVVGSSEDAYRINFSKKVVDVKKADVLKFLIVAARDTKEARHGSSRQ